MPTALSEGRCPASATVTVAVPTLEQRSGWTAGPDRAPVLFAGDGLAVEVDPATMKVRALPPIAGATVEALGYDVRGRVLAWAQLTTTRRESPTPALCAGDACVDLDADTLADAVDVHLVGLSVEEGAAFRALAPPRVVSVAEGDAIPVALGLPVSEVEKTRPQRLLGSSDVDAGALEALDDPPPALTALSAPAQSARWRVWNGPRPFAVWQDLDEPGEPVKAPVALGGPAGFVGLPGIAAGEPLSFSLAGPWLILCAFLGDARVIDLRTGQAVWSAKGTCPVFWGVSYG